MTGGGSKTCTGIDFARCRRSGGCSGAPGGSREGAGSSPEGLGRSFRLQNGSKMERSRPGFAPPTRCSVPETTRVLGEIDLAGPISSFRVYDPSFRAANDEPWFENTLNSCVTTVLSSFALSLLGGRRMWPHGLSNPPTPGRGVRAGLWE